MCECALGLRQEEQKRDRFGTVAIDVHRMFDHDSTALTTRAPGLDWTSAGLPLIQGVHRNLRTNPVDPSSPTPKVNSHNSTHCLMHTGFHRCLVCLPQCGLYSFRAQNKVERRRPVGSGISRGVTGLYPSRMYTHPVTLAIEVSHAVCKAEF